MKAARSDHERSAAGRDRRFDLKTDDEGGGRSGEKVGAHGKDSVLGLCSQMTTCVMAFDWLQNPARSTSSTNLAGHNRYGIG